MAAFEIDQRVLDCNYKDCKIFVPDVKYGKVIKCYDGDTVTIATIQNDELVRFSVRMLGYDTAEIKSKDPTEKQCAKAAQADICEMVLGKIVKVEKNEGLDKYGRLLLEISVDGVSVNKYMKGKWGVSYYGGHKNDVDWSDFPKIPVPEDTVPEANT